MGFLARLFDRIRGITPEKRRRRAEREAASMRNALVAMRGSLDGCRHLHGYAVRKGERRRLERAIAGLEKEIAKLEEKLRRTEAEARPEPET